MNTFDSRILRQLTSLAIPMIISQGAFAVMIFTDRLFLSMVSPLHMAAGLGGGVASFFCMSLFIGVLSYSNALIAQYYGAGELKRCSKVVSQSLRLCLAFVPLLSGVGYAISLLFSAMGHAPEQVELERGYFFILISGAVLMLLKVSFASFFAGTGKTKIVMVADILGVGCNIPLSYLLIFGGLGIPEMGINGAAIGTIIGNVLSLSVLLLFYFQRSQRVRYGVLESFGFDPSLMKRYLKLGLPAGFEMFLTVAAFNLFLLMFQSYGVVEAASAAIVLNWDILSFVPMLGLSTAMVSLVGRYIGANDFEKVGQVIRSGFILGVGYTSIIAFIFLVFREPLVAVFLDGSGASDDIQSLSSYMMVGLASYVVADAVIQVSGGSLRGAGDTLWVMKAAITLHWVMLFAQIAVIKWFELEARYSWVVFVVLIFSISVTYSARLFFGRWKSTAHSAS